MNTVRNNINVIDGSEFDDQKYIQKRMLRASINTRKQILNMNPLSKGVMSEYIFSDDLNKWFVWIGIPAVIIQLIAFKILYPFAGFINGDSYSYLLSAYHNYNIDTYPIGYSRFLRLFSVFSKWDTALVSFQYLLLICSLFYFIFSIFYFFKPTKWTRSILFCVTLFNPVFLYLANYVSSDALFLSISLIWFTQLLWILYRPTGMLIISNAVVLFIAFIVRYNALFYPILSIIALMLTNYRVVIKIAGVGLSILLIAAFIQFTSYQYYKISGIRQFSPFTGWQIANNALYGYRSVDSLHKKDVPIKFRKLDRMVRTYFDTSHRELQRNPQELIDASTVYMWDPNSPLQIYKRGLSVKDTTSELQKWATAAPLLSEYGYFLIRSYPNEYLKHYLLPNILKYYAPPVEFLETYSTGIDTVHFIAQAWFGYESNKLTTRFKDFKVNIFKYSPILVGVFNVVFFFGVLSFLILRGYRYNYNLRLGLLLAVSLWILNLAFSVFASPIALRFQLFPIIVSFTFSLLLVEFMVKVAVSSEHE